jgi:hypothetical protein
MNRNDISIKQAAGALAIIVIIAVFCLSYVIFPRSPGFSNAGFGSDWDCWRPGKGGLVCLKHAGEKGQN